MQAVAHPQSLSPVGHDKRRLSIPLLRWVLCLCVLYLAVPADPGPSPLGPHSWPLNDGGWPARQSQFIWATGTKTGGSEWLSHAAATERYLTKYQKHSPRDAIQVPATTHSAQSTLGLSSTHRHTPLPILTHPSSPLLPCCLQLNCTALLQQVALNPRCLCCASLFFLSSPLCRPSLVVCFSIPKKHGFGEIVSRFSPSPPTPSTFNLLFHWDNRRRRLSLPVILEEPRTCALVV